MTPPDRIDPRRPDENKLYSPELSGELTVYRLLGAIAVCLLQLLFWALGSVWLLSDPAPLVLDH